MAVHYIVVLTLCQSQGAGRPYTCVSTQCVYCPSWFVVAAVMDNQYQELCRPHIVTYLQVTINMQQCLHVTYVV